jgi:flagellar hook assembly protein FlgD
VILNVYDITGKLVSTLVDENKLPGQYTVRWDGKNLRGLSVASGIYFYKIEAGPFVSMKRMTFLK